MTINGKKEHEYMLVSQLFSPTLRETPAEA
jgi:hypothetical protein